jgi:hypothetical protein
MGRKKLERPLVERLLSIAINMFILSHVLEHFEL